MTLLTIHVEPANDTLTFWAEGPHFTACDDNLTSVVNDSLEVSNE